MTSRRFARLARALVLASLASTGCSSKDEPAAATDPTALAADAFVWGFPLVVTQRTMQTLGVVGVNRLINAQALANATTRVIVMPNQDTLYSVGILDVRNEPMVLTVPDTLDRYWTYQFLDGWTNSFHYIGTRATAGRGGSFAITAPGWTGTLPAGVEKVESPTPELFLLGRYLVRDAADVPNVTAIVRTLAPLSSLTGDPAAPASPGVGTAPGTPQSVGADGAAFFDELGDVLAVNGPASSYDRAELARFESLGIGPDLHPASSGDGGSVAALADGVAQGRERIETGVDQIATEQNGWRILLDVGTYTDNFLTRAAVARFGWAANVPEESIYPLSTVDGNGQAYDGNTPYVLHFAASALPPVDPALGFWSLTLYGPDMFFVENSIQRYAIGDRTAGLSYNADGSLDLYIQNAAPVGREGNWLPAPLGPFVLVMRLYLPSAAVVSGSYAVPPVLPQ